jgi:hypothetical protein
MVVLPPSRQEALESLSMLSGDWPSTTKEAIWKEKDADE